MTCEHSVEPRRPTTCLKCGREVSGRWLRSLERERDLALRASEEPEFTESLVRFAQFRSGSSQVRRLSSRNFRLDVMEELADALNYLCWLDDSKAVRGEGGLNAGELAALQHVTLAWRWLHLGGDA